MKRLLFLALIAATAVSSAAQAQTLEDRLRSQLAAVTTQLRALQAQQAAQTDAQAAGGSPDVAKLKAQLATAEAELRSSRRRLAETAAATDPVKGQVAALTQAKAQGDADLAAQREMLAALRVQIEQLKAQNDRLSATLASTAQALDQSQARTLQAIAVAKSILAAYARVTVADVLARKEPVTGLARARIERLEQTFEDRIAASRPDRRPATASQPPSP